MFGGRLQWNDLTSTEKLLVLVLARVGSVEGPARAQVRGDLIAQLASRSGPIGRSFDHFKSLHIEGFLIADRVDLADTVVHPILFVDCVFVGFPESLDVSRSDVRDIRLLGCWLLGGLRGENSKTSGNFWLRDCVFGEPLNLMRATVDGVFVVDGCQFESTSELGHSLSLDGVDVKGLFQVRRSSILGALSLREATLRSQGTLESLFIVPEGEARSELLLAKTTALSELKVGPDVAVDDVKAEAFRSESDLVLTMLNSPQGNLTVDFDRALVQGGTQIIGIESASQIALRGARVGSLQISKSDVRAVAFSPSGAEISPPPEGEHSRYAISADGIRVDGDVTLGPDLDVIGEIRFIGAEVHGQVQYFRGSILKGAAINLEEAEVRSAVFLDDIDVRSVIHIAGARIGGLFVAPDALPNFNLVRAKYGYISDRDGQPPTASMAIRMLASTTQAFSLAPYREMAGWLSAQGEDRSAQAVSIEGERLARRTDSRAVAAVFWLWRVSVGYGYAPIRALFPFAGLLVVATVLFAIASASSPTAEWFAQPAFSPVETEPAVFNPLLYALSAMIPFFPSFLSAWMPSNVAVQLITIFFQAIGWLLLTAIVAGVANRVRRG